VPRRGSPGGPRWGKPVEKVKVDLCENRGRSAGKLAGYGTTNAAGSISYTWNDGWIGTSVEVVVKGTSVGAFIIENHGKERKFTYRT
jgi:hypothetical protein